MSTPYVGEIRAFSYDRIPQGWFPCHGQLLPISQNVQLFEVIQNWYGGDGHVTFALPNLNGRVALGEAGTGSKYLTGTTGGEQAVTLTTDQLGQHNHTIGNNTGAPNTQSPMNFAGAPIYGPLPPNTNMKPLTATGATQPHNNMQPFATVMFAICAQGTMPSS
jgi:microcystin-dependent protein